MHAGEPDVFYVLTFVSREHEVLAETFPALVDRHGVTDDFHRRVVGGMGEGPEIVDETDGAHGVPDSDEMNRAWSCESRFEFRAEFSACGVWPTVLLPVAQRVWHKIFGTGMKKAD